MAKTTNHFFNNANTYNCNWAIPENIHTPPMTTLEILEEMVSEHDWKSTNFRQILYILTGIPGKPFKFLQNSGIPQDFESAGSGIP